MTSIWYCTHCGYEVDSGGRCHNCKEPLVPSPLDELSEGEVDEVGYRLGDWEDAARGELIHQLVESGIRHRFEGDELVVAEDDEPVVDRLMGQFPATPSGELADETGDQELDPATVSAIQGLYDAARRLRSDPTDMMADSDLAESSAGVFALDHLYGADRDTWSAVGRVTRRLLGALGADEAMEAEIQTQAAILCRLLDPVIAGLHQAEAAAEEEAEEERRQDHQELIYELPDWLPEERAQLSLLLDRDGIPHEWEDSDLVVPEADESRVEPLFDEVDRAPAEGGLPAAPEGVDDEAEYQALSDLFGAADRLAGDPADSRKRGELLDAASAVDDWPVPFGMTDDQWWQIRSRSRAARESIEADDDGAVAQNAAVLRTMLRGFV
jgi:hypothetical protein